MGRIQTNIGLITGMAIGDTVDQLMALAAAPRDQLAARTSLLEKEQVAVTELSAMLLAVQYVTDNLGKADLFERSQATSGAPDFLAATVTGKPANGLYQFTPLRTVQSQQLLSSGIRSDSEPIGAGTLRFRFGSNVQRSATLDLIGGGEGIARGKIRVTDRSGASSEIDLSRVQTIDDVLEAINTASAINVTAVAQGDKIRLVDNTGQAVSNLKVQEVGRSTTAASLGLAGIDVAGDVADGQDIFRLTREMELDALNDGNGVRVSVSLPDLEYNLRDGTHGTIDLSPIVSGSSEVQRETTLGEMLDVINQAAPDKLKVEIAPGGDRLIVTDLTEGENPFTLTSLYDSKAAEGLGIDGGSVDGTITGRRLLGGLKTVLLSSLNGGNGVGELGLLELTDRGGASDTVDLSGAETLQDVVDAINASTAGITARINDAQTGIVLSDTTGLSNGSMVVADGDATETAGKLGIAVNGDVAKIDSGDMHLQVIGHNTRLEDLNGGAGMAKGKLTITDSTGLSRTLDLRGDTIQTVGDVITAIHRLGVAVRAEINETGDGIRLRDIGGGDGRLRVIENGSTTAADLHILGVAEDVEIDGETKQVIDGSGTYTVTLDDDDTLDDLKRKINNLQAGVAASIFVDGSSKPYRLALTSQRAGEAGAMVIDASDFGFSLQETVAARDALLTYGQSGIAGAEVLVSSTSNSFDNLVDGLRLQVKQASASPVTVSIATTDTDLTASVQAMVENYNRFRTTLAKYTAYDPDQNVKAVLTGDSAALRLDTELSQLLSGRILGAGSIQSVAELGLTFNDDGTLAFDSAKLKAKFAADPAAVKAFFTTAQTGLSARFKTLSEQLANPDNSLLSHRFDALLSKIEQNSQRIELMDARLEKQREQMLMKFYRMELAIAKIQSNMTAIESIRPLPSMLGSGDE
ncbi:MAG: flagellar filament capping protein FliD [Rhodopirellula sp.]|nr:flagellar filament capping protein FliD [Rhodopirellula sp.]